MTHVFETRQATYTDLLSALSSTEIVTKQISIMQTLYTRHKPPFCPGADPGYVKKGGGEIQKGGQVADITRK